MIMLIITLLSIIFWIFLSIRVLLFTKSLKKPIFRENIDLPSLSIIIPARNEQMDIEACVMSLVNQDYPNLEIIIVDDDSTDNTPYIADNLASKYENIKVLHLKELPDGWTGKPNALYKGAEKANGIYLLFSDADMIHEPHSLCTLMSDMISNKIMFYSVLPKLIWKGHFESMFAPAMQVGYAKYSSLAKEESKRNKCAAVGGLIIINREIYDSIGGHSAIKDSIVDDIDLACLFKKNGYFPYLRFAPHLVSVRMFKGNINLIKGFSKNLMFAFSYSPLIIFPLILLGLFCFLPGIISIMYGFVQMNLLLIISGIIHYIYVYFSFFSVSSFNSTNYLYMLLYPIVCLILPIPLVISFYNLVFRKSVIWRNRRIRIK